MALGNLCLFLGDVARHLNDLHTVEQRAWDRVEVVGCGNEQHLGEIVVYIQEVVVEGIVLLRIEHLQKG